MAFSVILAPMRDNTIDHHGEQTRAGSDEAATSTLDDWSRGMFVAIISNVPLSYHNCIGSSSTNVSPDVIKSIAGAGKTCFLYEHIMGYFF